MMNTRSMTLRVLHVNAIVIHSTSLESVSPCLLSVDIILIFPLIQAFAYAMYQLAAHPELVTELREEVEAVAKEDGWTKAGMMKMRKLESFIMESQRLYGAVPAQVQRKARKDFTFSDGTTIPAGSFAAFASYAEHHDEVRRITRERRRINADRVW
jgi:hypothetical protein